MKAGLREQIKNGSGMLAGAPDFSPTRQTLLSRMLSIAIVQVAYRAHMQSFVPERDYCFAVRQAARYISRLYEHHLSAVGLTPSQFSILVALTRKPEMTMVELAEAMVLDRTSLVRALKPLTREGLVSGSSSGAARRTLLVEITPDGIVKLRESAEHWRAAQVAFEAEFGKRPAELLRRELFRATRDLVKT